MSEMDHIPAQVGARQPRQGTCRTCRWWRGNGQPHKPGNCCRFAPTEHGWPKTFIHNGCGEHEERGRE